MRRKLLTLASVFFMLSVSMLSLCSLPGAEATELEPPGWALIAAPCYGESTHIDEAKELRDYLLDHGWTDDRIIFLADWDADYVDGTAYKADIKDAIKNNIAKESTEDDIVFLAVLDHATERDNGHVYFRTSDPDEEDETAYIKDTRLAKWVSKITNFDTMVIYISSPHSGGFVDELEDNCRIVIADCQQEQSYTQREYTLAEALQAKKADTDKDGRITVEEAYAYMEVKMTLLDPEIYDYQTDEQWCLY